MELQSNEVDKIAAALLAVQGQLEPALKSSENPFFHSSYASLESVWEACRTPLQDNGIVAIQGAGPVDGEPHLITTLLHKSGQWIRGAFPLPISTITTKENKDGKEVVEVKTNPQALGSTISYLRRYSLASMVGVVTKDDDAESAMDRDNDLPPNQQPPTSGPGTKAWDLLADKIAKAEAQVPPERAEEIKSAWMEENGLMRKVDATIKQLETLHKTMSDELPF
jgi:hypothetical protein